MISRICAVLTTYCNLNCSYCWYSRQETGKPKENLQIEPFLKFLKQAHDFNPIEAVELTGGEVLLHPDLSSLIKQLAHLTPNIILMTNGVLLEGSWIGLFEQFNLQVHVSLDSVEPEYHNGRRGGHANTMAALEALTKSKISKRKLCVTISRDNLNEIPAFMAFASKNKFEPEFNLVDLDRNNERSWHHADASEVKRLAELLTGWAEMYHRGTKLKLMLYCIKNQTYHIPACLFQKQSIVVDSNGAINPCYYKNEPLGNIYINDFDDVFEKRRQSLNCSTAPLSCFKMRCAGIFL